MDLLLSSTVRRDLLCKVDIKVEEKEMMPQAQDNTQLMEIRFTDLLQHLRWVESIVANKARDMIIQGQSMTLT